MDGSVSIVYLKNGKNNIKVSLHIEVTSGRIIGVL